MHHYIGNYRVMFLCTHNYKWLYMHSYVDVCNGMYAYHTCTYAHMYLSGFELCRYTCYPRKPYIPYKTHFVASSFASCSELWNCNCFPSLFGLRSEHGLFHVQKPENEEQNFGPLRWGQSTSFVFLPCLSHSKSLLARVRHREMLFYPEHILNSLSHHTVGHLYFVLYLTIYVEPYIKIPVSDLFL